MSGEIDSVDKEGVRVDTFSFSPWTIRAGKSHILHSNCVAPAICQKASTGDLDRKCMVCQFNDKIQLPSLPEMTFARNSLEVVHEQGFGLHFNPLDALSMVSKQPLELEVGAARVWQGARVDCQFAKRQIIKPFDWTYSTQYQGTLVPASVDNESSQSLRVVDSEERIDMNKLKRKDDILYYDNIDLFEDELADHGIAQLSVKMRIMKSSFFILLRYFLRVDGTKGQVIDTRYFHEKGANFIQKEFSVREAMLDKLDLTIPELTDPVQLSSKLPMVSERVEKLMFPE